jgi:NDP-sugar pyrophosphorylase family protein
MRAVILAGGKGTRLAPYTTVFPKPLVPIGHQPILEVIIRQLIRCGFDRVTLNVGYLAELIEAYFITARPNLPPFELDYVKELQPTGTAGSISLVNGLDDTFLVMNGDVLTTLNYRKLVEYHREHGAALTVAMHRRSWRSDFGVIETAPDNRITGYLEKPMTEHMVSMGIYVYEPRVLAYIEPGRYLDFPDLVLKLLAAGETVIGYPSDDYWLDIGRHDDYELAQSEFERLRSEFLPE